MVHDPELTVGISGVESHNSLFFGVDPGGGVWSLFPNTVKCPVESARRADPETLKNYAQL